MKIKALKRFVYGRFDANKGEVLDVPDDVGLKLVKVGFAETKEEPEDLQEDSEEEPEEPTKVHVTAKKTGKTGAKTSARR